jgi:hypothetical protein
VFVRREIGSNIGIRPSYFDWFSRSHTVKFNVLALLIALAFLLVPRAPAQTRKPLTNDDIVNMTKQGFDPPLIVKAVETNATDFDVSATALLSLKNSGVDSSVMEAMLTAQADKPSAAPDALHGAAADTSNSTCSLSKGCLIREGTELSLKFESDLNSKTALDGDPVEFVLDNDLKIGETTLVKKGAHAMATVSNAKKAGNSISSSNI